MGKNTEKTENEWAYESSGSSEEASQSAMDSNRFWFYISSLASLSSCTYLVLK